jgi:hypothetical protein
MQVHVPLNYSAAIHMLPFIQLFIIINIKGWAIWPVQSPELQLHSYYY